MSTEPIRSDESPRPPSAARDRGPSQRRFADVHVSDLWQKKSLRTSTEPSGSQVEATAAAKDIAIVVAHGMGQQLPFETVEGVAEAIRSAAGSTIPITTRFASLDGVPVPRAEFALGGRSVHVYEIYWAPLTEDRVGVRDVIGFLWHAIVNHLKHGRATTFQRIMFGNEVDFPTSAFSVLAIYGLGIVLASLLAIVAVGAAVGGAGVLGLSSPAKWLTAPVIDNVTLDLALFALTALVGLGLGLGLPRGYRKVGIATGRPPLALQVAAWSFVFLVTVTTVVIAVLMLWHVLAAGRGDLPWNLRSLTWPDWLSRIGQTNRNVALIVIWGAAALVLRKAKLILTQFPGDVAAYISAYRVSRFAEIREAIQSKAALLLRSIYASQAGYESVFVVGHSLGSVVAYDGLNRLILEDNLEGRARRVAKRTELFLTFGSPLDKIAYVFRVQRPRNCVVRESLAQARQPFIDDPTYADRPRRWINLYSPHDLIGARLDYFDVPGGAGGEQRICNLNDPEAFTPLQAHTEHWQSSLLGNILKWAIAGTLPNSRDLEAQVQRHEIGRPW